MKTKLLVGLSLFFIIAIGIAFLTEGRRSQAVPPATRATLNLPAGDLEASDAFLRDYAEWKALLARLDKMEHSSGLVGLRDQVNGMGRRLSEVLPPGYQFNEKLMAFEPVKPSTAPAAPANKKGVKP